MKLFRRRKKNNKGFSLVEMICAIAILGLASSAVGSAMVMSTDSYQRGSAEVDVQKEAQQATNLIGNLIVDAVQVRKTDTGSVTTELEIDGEGITYNLTYDQTTEKISYAETVGTNTSYGVLAEDVTFFKVGDVDFTISRNVKVDMIIEKNGKQYMASYNTTARNGASFNVGAEASAIIVCDTEVVLEPNQEYDFKVELYGNPTNENLAWGNIIPSNPDAEDDDIQLINAGNAGTVIKVSDDAEGDYSFKISTRASEEINGIDVPLDSKMVTVHIRRAKAISYQLELRSGVDKQSGAQYRIYGDVTGDNFAKVIGKAFDDGDVDARYEYINPVYVTFAPRAEGGAAFKILDGGDNTNPNAFSEIDRPYIDIELTADMPANSKIAVTLQSKHANGGNKTGQHYADIITECTIENLQRRIEFPSGIRRGNDNMINGVGQGINSWVTDLSPSAMSQAFGGTARWYFRYRDVNSTQWTPYYPTKEGGEATKFNAIETELWELDKAYEIEVICMSFSDLNTANPKLEFPQDPTLLAELDTQARAGWYDGVSSVVQGWDLAADIQSHPDKVATSFPSYGGSTTLGASEIIYELNGSQQESIGSCIGGNFEEGFKIQGNSDYKVINYIGVNIETGHYGYTYKVAFDNSGWQDITIDNCKNNHINLQCNNTSLRIDNRKDLSKGKKYRLGIVAVGTFQEITYNNLRDIPTYSDSNKQWDLHNFTSDKGSIYFEVSTN